MYYILIYKAAARRLYYLRGSLYSSSDPRSLVSCLPLSIQAGRLLSVFNNGSVVTKTQVTFGSNCVKSLDHLTCEESSTIDCIRHGDCVDTRVHLLFVV